MTEHDVPIDGSRLWIIQPDTMVTVSSDPDSGLVTIQIGEEPDEKYLVIHPEGAYAAASPLFKAGLDGRQTLARLAQRLAEPTDGEEGLS